MLIKKIIYGLCIVILFFVPFYLNVEMNAYSTYNALSVGNVLKLVVFIAIYVAKRSYGNEIVMVPAYMSVFMYIAGRYGLLLHEKALYLISIYCSVIIYTIGLMILDSVFKIPKKEKAMVYGIMYRNGVFKPALYLSDLEACFQLIELKVDPAKRWLKFKIRIYQTPSVWSTITGSKSVYKNASMVPRDSTILSMTPDSTKAWECLHMSLENNTDSNFLLPANEKALSGKSVLRMAWKEIATNNIYYLENEISDMMFDEMMSLAYTPSSSNKDALNENIYWFLNCTTQDGAAMVSSLTSTSTQKGLVYNAVQIKQAIGKSAFDQTFQYFDQLSSLDMPQTKLGRLNLFLTKLRDYSNTDVIEYFSNSGKSACKSIYGGNIAYSDIHEANWGK